MSWIIEFSPVSRARPGFTVSRDELCCCRRILNVTTQWQEGSCVWLVEWDVLSMEWVTKCIAPCDSQPGICLCQSNVCNRDTCTSSTPDGTWLTVRPKGLWLLPDFLFSLEVSPGTWNSCYSISAEQLMAVMRRESKLNTETVFFFFFASFCAEFYKVSFSFSYAPCIWFTLDVSWKN